MDLMIPMRDGVRLATNLWRPEGPEPVPALLVRLPYGKDALVALHGPPQPVLSDLLEAGYAIAIQDCRGTFRSEGRFVPYRADAEDGVDTVEWLARQQWCTGEVGTYGGSYLGVVQWLLAAAGAAPLRAIAPAITSADCYRSSWYSPGGALSLEGVLQWTAAMAFGVWRRDFSLETAEAEDGAALAGVMADLRTAVEHTPVDDHPLVEQYAPWLKEVLAHPERDEYWDGLAPIDAAGSITVPALSIGGWYDVFLPELLRAYTVMRTYGGSPAARDGQQLIVGPWSHTNTRGLFPDRWYGVAGDAAAAQLTRAYLAFFNRWLRGRHDALNGLPRVRIFVMGIDEWRDEDDWPLPDTSYTDFYLGSGGQANTASGDGRLDSGMSAVDQHDTFLYDPRRPVPTVGGAGLTLSGFEGPADQSPVEWRADVLCYTSAVLEAPMEVTGPISLDLWVSTSARDTDFSANLVDVHPDGRALLLCQGMQRLRYRNSLRQPELAEPGRIYRVHLEVGATSNVFLPGHRIRLEISSSNFPRYDRNSNTGGAIATEREEDMIPAINCVHHGPGGPSHLTLPVIIR
jgi:putative CocE/NonD family hydrolase